MKQDINNNVNENPFILVIVKLHYGNGVFWRYSIGISTRNRWNAKSVRLGYISIYHNSIYHNRYFLAEIDNVIFTKEIKL